MAKSIFQKIADWIASIQAPAWLKNLLQEIQDLIIATLLQIGKAYVDGLVEQILYAANQDWPSEKKYEFVFKWGRENIPDIKDAALNLAIEILVNLYKKNNFVRVT